MRSFHFKFKKGRQFGGGRRPPLQAAAKRTRMVTGFGVEFKEKFGIRISLKWVRFLMR